MNIRITKTHSLVIKLVKKFTTTPEPIPTLHSLPVQHGKYDGLKPRHTSKELEEWINTNHRCTNCNKVIRYFTTENKYCEVTK